MVKIIVIGLIVLAAIVLAIWTLIIKGKSDMLDKREAKLKEESLKLQSMRDALTADEKTFDSLVYDCKNLMESSKEVTAAYVVTESDTMKYNSDTAIRNVARNRIAYTIASKLVKEFPEPKRDGDKFIYHFKVLEV